MTTLYDDIVQAALALGPLSGLPREDHPVHPEDARAALGEIGQVRAAGERIRAEAMLGLAAWAGPARRAGISVAEIARLAGVTRVTVYEQLRRSTQ